MPLNPALFAPPLQPQLNLAAFENSESVLPAEGGEAELVDANTGLPVDPQQIASASSAEQPYFDPQTGNLMVPTEEGLIGAADTAQEVASETEAPAVLAEEPLMFVDPNTGAISYKSNAQNTEAPAVLAEEPQMFVDPESGAITYQPKPVQEKQAAKARTAPKKRAKKARKAPAKALKKLKAVRSKLKRAKKAVKRVARPKSLRAASPRKSATRRAAPARRSSSPRRTVSPRRASPRGVSARVSARGKISPALKKAVKKVMKPIARPKKKKKLGFFKKLGRGIKKVAKKYGKGIMKAALKVASTAIPQGMFLYQF
jgi:hypothetical protein